MNQLKFHKVICAVDIGFWQVLAKKKLEEIKLSTADIDLWGYYAPSGHKNLPGMVRILPDSLDPEKQPPHGSVKIPGVLRLFNTKEELNSVDSAAVLAETGQAVREGSLTNTFILLAFADLKNYVFHYWFGLPIVPFPPVQHAVCGLEEFAPEAWVKAFLAEQFPQPSLKACIPVAKAETSLVEVSVADCEFVLFIDPVASPDYPSALLRNFLAQLTLKGTGQAKVLLVKDPFSADPLCFALPNSKAITVEAPATLEERFIGWEANKEGKLLPKSVDLRPQLDPEVLASSSLELNLKLMRWRMLPSLDLETIANTRCLLLGAGTLGSQVARNLLAWGVRTITFVDSSRVSYSNPARQSLYEFEDAREHRFKAEAAAAKLKKIDPSVNTTGVPLQIPMPGHSLSSRREQAVKDTETLHRLVEEHDAVFLLLDSREARWLGTVMCASLDKLCLSVGLGFDSFLVLRHLPGLLGCYFCSDVVGPRNSLIDRTLDQMCTVTRPGLSYQASAIAVELMVSLLQHAEKHHAPHDAEGILGRIPHQLRGTFSNFSLNTYCGSAFSKCTACSDKVLEEYRTRGFAFVEQVCNEPDFLEELCELQYLDDLDEGDLIEIDSLSD